MSTRSVVGYIDTKGKVSAVYCHYDGYPEHMVEAIESFLSIRGVAGFRANIRKAQSEGGIRQFQPYAIETFGEKNVDPEGCSYTRRDITAGNHEEYCYLVDKTGKIVEYHDRDGQQTIETMHKRAVG